MQDLLFLGQIPFTNYYINFWGWLAFMVITAPLVIFIFRNRRKFSAWLLAVYVAWLIRRYKQDFQI